MGKYKEVREVIVNSLSDKQWHGVDEIQSKCEEEGINLEGNFDWNDYNVGSNLQNVNQFH